MLMSNVKHSAAKSLKLLCPNPKQPAALCCNFPCVLVPPGLCQNFIRTQNPFKPWLPAPSPQSEIGSSKAFHLTPIHLPVATRPLPALPLRIQGHPHTATSCGGHPKKCVRSLSNCWRRSMRQRRIWRSLLCLDLLTYTKLQGLTVGGRLTWRCPQ